MFHLVKYRWFFLLLSLVIIVPGTISLIFKGLDVGIDFVGGSVIQFQPQQAVTKTQVQQWLTSYNLAAESITIGDFNGGPKEAAKTVWVRLNTKADSTVTAAITKSLQDNFPGAANANNTNKISVKFDDLAFGGQTKTVVTVTGFKDQPTESAIRSALNKIPNTGTSATASASPTPTATATATSKASTTPTATSTATTTSGSNTSNAAGTPVSIEDVKVGGAAKNVTVQTTTPGLSSKINQIQSSIIGAGGPYTYISSNSEVGGTVAGDTVRNAFLAVLVASGLILLYVWFAFRKIIRPWRYGACAILALLHDVLVVVGIFSILGWVLHTQIDALFITALLTVVGFSVHDTIVVFDRIRENMQRSTTETFEQVVDASLIQTMARSLNTSLTVLFTLLALTLFTQPGTSVHNFTLALLIGIFSGTYSSIFNASMLLVMWEKGEFIFKFFNRTPAESQASRSNRKERELARARG